MTIVNVYISKGINAWLIDSYEGKGCALKHIVYENKRKVKTASEINQIFLINRF